MQRGSANEMPGKAKSRSADWPKRLADRLAELGWSQNDLASRIDRSPSAVGHWLGGRREPSIAEFERLAGALGVPACWLVWGEGGVTAPEPEVLDERLLASCIKAVEDVAVEMRLELTPEQIAKLAAYVYAERGQVQPSALKQLFRIFLT